ncbi:acyl-CoA dehydrogenase family protein [Streptomyces sp. NPDC059893]|uniref:acyl-CoA dehydrogenase family protein n=1 Tax=Streptomyces sp. NPDC059893 TaxID=3346990 RepID=UPI0036681D73
MDFELSDEQAMLRGASRDLLSDHASAPDEVWRLAADLGWPGLAVPEEYGGTGQGVVELALVEEELGRFRGPAPFLPTVLVARALARDGSPRIREEVLPVLAEGAAWAAWAFAEPRSPWTPDGIRATARTEGDSVVLDGVKTAVQDADGARWLLVTACLDSSGGDGGRGGVPVSFLVDRAAPGVTVRRQRSLDLTRTSYEVRLDGVRVPAERRLGGGPGAVQRLLDDASVLVAADTLGVMDRLLDMTVSYMKVRVQFGQPLGSFQAVKHACASMAVAVQGTRAATAYAAMAADAGSSDAARAACVAASYASAAAGEVAGSALQLHGGIGFTWEHELHLYLRRAKTDAVLYGDASVHRDRLCTLIRPTHALSA